MIIHARQSALPPVKNQKKYSPPHQQTRHIHNNAGALHVGFISDTDWKSTFVLNLERAVAAGAVWTVLRLFGLFPDTHIHLHPVAIFLGFPAVYFMGIVPLGLIAYQLHQKGYWWASLFSAFCSILIIVGDPLVFALSKAAPHLVPISEFRLFNRVLVYVIKAAASARGSIGMDTLSHPN